MLQKPKDPIQMKRRGEKKQMKENGKFIPQPERNPLQDSNSLSSEGCEAPKTKISNYSSASSSSEHIVSRKPKSSVKCTINTTSSLKAATCLTNPGSRKKPSIEKNAAFPKSKMNQARLHRLQNDERPKSKNGKRSIFPSDFASGCEKSEVKLMCIKPEKVSGESINLKEIENNLNVKAEQITPFNKSFRGSSSNSAIFEYSNANSSSNSKVNTPPIEASISPEIQFGASAFLISAATPTVCYSTGHVLSGVTDRRKCRSRGILTVGDAVDYTFGSEKDRNESDGNYNYDGKVNENVEESESFIPLPSEASVKWLLSPCDEECGSPNEDSSSKLMSLVDVDGSSPSVCIGSDSDIVCDSSKHVPRVLDTPADSGKTCMISPRRFSEFERFTGIFPDKIDGDLLSNGLVEQDKNGFHRTIIEEKSPLSIGSLSSGNVIQTPNSDYTSGGNNCGCWLKSSEHSTCTFKPELDSEAQILGRSRSILDPPGLSFQFTDLSSSSHSVDVRKNFDNLVSSVSVSSVDCMSQSHMRISWRDLLSSRSIDMDELDCCRCLSDEDIGVDELQKLGNDCSSRRENCTSTGSACKSPESIEHEIAFPLRKKEKKSPCKPKSCAESISTDGGGLAASEDFD